MRGTGRVHADPIVSSRLVERGVGDNGGTVIPSRASHERQRDPSASGEGAGGTRRPGSSPSPSPSRREMTSAVDGMSVAEVRQSLAHIRSVWALHSMETPLCSSTSLWNGMTFSQFAFWFVLGQHRKRHRKCVNRPDARAAKRAKKKQASLAGQPGTV